MTATDPGMPADVSAETCAALRRRAGRSTPVGALAAEFALDPAVVRTHVWGRCDHAVDVPPVPIE